jgi:two-component system cell cycle sensor histidine kinase/response regulator CckA
VFHIYLPRYYLAGSGVTAHAEEGAAKDLTGIGTVMLVEDEDPVRIFGSRALRNKGYTAIELIRNGEDKIDLLITDVVMPHLDGPGLVREVHKTQPDVKVLFISGYTSESFRERLDAADSEIHFLPKPFNLKQLVGAVKDVT